MKKKMMLATACGVALFSLAACGGSKNIATWKGGAYTQQEFYDQTKTSQTSQTFVRKAIIFSVFDKAYGNKVDKKAVDKQFDETKKSLGDNFKSQLEQAGYTEASYKEELRQNEALQAGLKAHVKITDEDKKAAWATFHPEVEASIITLTSEEDAKKVLAEVKKSGADFAKIAKEKSTDTTTKADGGKVKFDSMSQTIPATVQEAAWKLKDGQISEVITSTDTQTYASTYYIVKMTKQSDKGNDMKKYEKQVNEVAEEAKLKDQTFVTKVIGEELKKANVEIKDSTFKNILADYTQTSSSKSTSTSSSKK